MNRVFFLLSLSGITMCSPKDLSKDHLSEFINDPANGLTKEVQANGYDLLFQYQPVDFVFANELSGSSNLNQKRDSLKKAYQNFCYFKLSISRKEQSIERYFAGSPEKHKSLLTHLNSSIGSNFQIAFADENIPVYDFVYTPFYGTSKTTDVMLVFDVGGHPASDFSIRFQDSFFGCGLQEFTFYNSDLKEIPELSLN
jgi:hypothetical protein